MAFPGEPATARERAIVAQQLGRDPRGDIAVAARCTYGLPAVIRTSPELDSGEPFPTLFYLTCPIAVRALGGVEASGKMREYEKQLGDDDGLRADYERAHRRYVEMRDSIAALGRDESAGGMPVRVKCLHALYAHEVADANPIGALVRDEIEPLGCPGDCVSEGSDGTVARVPGHPGFSKRRR
ncbi:MAG: DUF501 domain-containing protein [Actinomycetota bacterium]